jgi:hypothetical protein
MNGAKMWAYYLVKVNGSHTGLVRAWMEGGEEDEQSNG